MRSARRNSRGALPTGSASSRLHSARSTRRSQASLSMTGATSRSKTTPRLESERKTAQPAQPSIALSLTEVRGSELWPESLPSLQSAVSLTVRSEIAQRGGDINNDAIVHQMRLGVDNHAASRLALAAQKRASNKASYDHAHAAVKQAKPTTTLRNSLKYTPTSRDKKASVPQYGSADQYYQALQDALLREDSDSTTDSDDDRFDVNAAVQKLTGSASSYVSPVDMWPVRAFPSGSSETMPSIDIDELRATFSKRGSATPSAASARSARGARGFSRPGLPRPKSAAALLGAKRPPAVHTAFAEGSAATGPFTPTAGAIGRPARQADRRTGDTVLQSPLGSSIRADPRDVVTPSAGAGGGAKGKGKTGSTSKSKGKGKGKGKDKGDEDVVIPELTSLMKKPPSFTAFGVPDVEPEFSSKSLRNRMSSSLLKSHAAQYNPFSVVHADASKAAAANSAKKPTAGARAVIADTATRPAGAAMTDAATEAARAAAVSSWVHAYKEQYQSFRSSPPAAGSWNHMGSIDGMSDSESDDGGDAASRGKSSTQDWLHRRQSRLALRSLRRSAHAHRAVDALNSDFVSSTPASPHSPFVTMARRPRSGSSIGGGLATGRSQQSLEAALASMVRDVAEHKDDAPSTPRQSFMAACEEQNVRPDLLVSRRLHSEDLNLQHFSLNDQHTTALAAAINAGMSDIRHVNLGGNRMSNTGLATTLTSLCKQQGVQSVEIWGIPLQRSSWTVLRRMMLTTNLVSVSLRKTAIADRMCTELCRAMPACRSLRHLDISENAIGNRGATVLGEVLTDAKAHVQYLDVSWNSFNEAASRALVCALATNTCLLELNMSYNRIGAAAADLGWALLSNTTLRKLDIRSTSIEAKATAALGTFLSENSSLALLHLGNNSISPCGCRAIVRSVADVKNRIVILDDCSFTTAGDSSQIKAYPFDFDHPGETVTADLSTPFGQATIRDLLRLIRWPGVRLDQCTITDHKGKKLGKPFRLDTEVLQPASAVDDRVSDLDEDSEYDSSDVEDQDGPQSASDGEAERPTLESHPAMIDQSIDMHNFTRLSHPGAESSFYAATGKSYRELEQLYDEQAATASQATSPSVGSPSMLEKIQSSSALNRVLGLMGGSDEAGGGGGGDGHSHFGLSPAQRQLVQQHEMLSAAGAQFSVLNSPDPGNVTGAGWGSPGSPFGDVNGVVSTEQGMSEVMAEGTHTSKTALLELLAQRDAAAQEAAQAAEAPPPETAEELRKRRLKITAAKARLKKGPPPVDAYRQLRGGKSRRNATGQLKQSPAASTSAKAPRGSTESPPSPLPSASTSVSTQGLRVDISAEPVGPASRFQRSEAQRRRMELLYIHHTPVPPVMRVVSDAQPGHEWVIPSDGVFTCQIDYQPERPRRWHTLPKSSLRFITNVARNPDLRDAEKFGFVEAALLGARLTSGQAADIVTAATKRQGDERNAHLRVDLVKLMLTKLIDPRRTQQLIVLLLNREARRLLRVKLGSLGTYVKRNPTGHYRLQLGNMNDRTVLNSLLQDATAVISEQAALGAADTSQLGNRQPFRNVTVGRAKEPFELTHEYEIPPLQAAIEQQLDLEFDYVSLRRPHPNRKALPDHKFQRLFREVIGSLQAIKQHVKRIVSSDAWKDDEDAFIREMLTYTKVIDPTTDVEKKSLGTTVEGKLVVSSEHVLKRLHARQSHRAKELFMKEYQTAVDDLRFLVQRKYVTTEQCKVLVSIFPTDVEGLRLRAFTVLFGRLLSLETALSTVLPLFTAEDQVQMYKQLGWLNLFNPGDVDRAHSFDLADREQRKVATMLVELAYKEPGPNFQDEKYSLITGWALPMNWIQKGLPEKGVVSFRYISSEQGCKPVWSVREKLQLKCLIGVDKLKAARVAAEAGNGGGRGSHRR